MHEVIDMDHLGRGIIKIDGKVVFVNGAITGDIIEVNIIEDKKKYSIGEIKTLITPSKDRREAICKYYNQCGGCNLMHMNYPSQVKYKKAKVQNIIKRYSNIEIDPIIIKSDKEFNYRNKITLHPSKEGLGFNKKNSNEVVKINNCKLAQEPINEVISDLDSDEDVILRCNDKEVISNILEKSDLIKEIKGYKFKINYNSFFQVNDYICSKLFELIEDFVEKEDNVLDLYSGVGTLSIVASSKAKKVYSVEINEYAYSNSLENIKLNNKTNIESILGDSAKVVLSFNKPFDTLIVDPPRSGLDKNTINFILNKKPNKLLYISCDPMSLGRDLNYLKETYKIKKSYVLDMFPNTHHCETVVVLEKNE